MPRPNKTFIKKMIEEGEQSFQEGRSSQDEAACRKELDGINKIEYAMNAKEPEYKSSDDEKKSARILWRSPYRKSFFGGCVASGSGRRETFVAVTRIPIPEPVRERRVESAPGSLDERADRLRPALDGLAGVDHDEALNNRDRLLEETISKDYRAADCRATLAFFLDSNAAIGKQYGLGISNEGVDVALYEEIGRRKEKLLKRCLRTYPRVVEQGPTETDIMYQQVELDGTKLRRKKKKAKKKVSRRK